MNGPATPEVTFDVTNTRLLNVSGTQTNSAAAANFTSDSLVMTFGTTNPVSITKGSNKLTLASGDSLDTTSADSLKQAGVIVPATIYWNFRLDPNATVTEYDLAIAKRAFKVVSIDVVPSTLQGGALTATIVNAPSAPISAKTPRRTSPARKREPVSPARYEPANTTARTTAPVCAIWLYARDSSVSAA